MSRVKRGIVSRKRHKRIIKKAKGFWGQRKNVFRRANETLLRAMRFSYVGRKLKKREYRGLFISRISAACKSSGINYSGFVNKMKTLQIGLNRKMLSQLAIFEPKAFAELVAMAKK
ncbi:MAG: 50S ribosomal protein L20 [candidate division TM6 bacterium GW2011_GWF2_37_49]|nr:MAG: 50S ribosomal protein L20 [candidate division TM6 bacterium GW2011_GWF2_37_49]